MSAHERHVSERAGRPAFLLAVESRTVATAGDQPRLHAHVVVGKRDGTAHGGHPLEARMRPTPDDPEA